MLRFLRIAVLLYVLAFVAVGALITAREATDWDVPLRVDIYPVNGDSSAESERRIEEITLTSFEAIDDFFRVEGARYGIAIEQPVRLRLAPRLDRLLPPVPDNGSPLAVMLWSLRMRWISAWLDWNREGFSTDVTVFAVFHAGEPAISLDRSTALSKGMIAVANVFADDSMQEENNVVIAHELLHTLGATDKYDLATTQPRFPDGYAEPEADPRLPQTRAEIMGGRIPISRTRAEMPPDLRRVIVGPKTAAEIGWL